MRLSKEIQVHNRLGLHARPAAMLVQTTSRFSSEVTIRRNDMEINAKSIMGIMMLAAECGAILELTVEGLDAEEALAAIEGLFNDKFVEEDAELEEL